MVAVVTYLFARGKERAIKRADRAEEIATLEQRELERTRQIEQGVEQLLQTHVRAANGDYSARAALGQNNILWQVSVSLNNLLNRLQRSSQAEFELQRVSQEIGRLVTAIQSARSGRQPLWPAPSKTPLDPLILEIVPRAETSNPGAPPNPGAYPPAPPIGPERADGRWSYGAPANPNGDPWWTDQSDSPGPVGWPNERR